MAPTIINTFLESADFSGKKIVFFATSGSSGMGNTLAGLKGSVSPTTVLVEGKMLTRVSGKELENWVRGMLN